MAENIDEKINELKNYIDEKVKELISAINKIQEEIPSNIGQSLMQFSDLIGEKIEVIVEGVAEIKKNFSGCNYSEFKFAVADAVADYLRPVREKFEDIRSNEKQLKEILHIGAENARKQAFKTLRKVYKKVGFISL